MTAVCLLALSVLPEKPAPIAAQSKTSLVRGRIDRKGQSRTYPAAYVRVTLAPEASKERRTSAYTGNDGMFYFRVPQGNYILEIWTSGNTATMKYRIQVKKEFFDLAPIVIP